MPDLAVPHHLRQAHMHCDRPPHWRVRSPTGREMGRRVLPDFPDRERIRPPPPTTVLPRRTSSLRKSDSIESSLSGEQRYRLEYEGGCREQGYGVPGCYKDGSPMLAPKLYRPPARHLSHPSMTSSPTLFLPPSDMMFDDTWGEHEQQWEEYPADDGVAYTDFSYTSGGTTYYAVPQANPDPSYEAYSPLEADSSGMLDCTAYQPPSSVPPETHVTLENGGESWSHNPYALPEECSTDFPHQGLSDLGSEQQMSMMTMSAEWGSGGRDSPQLSVPLYLPPLPLPCEPAIEAAVTGALACIVLPTFPASRKKILVPQRAVIRPAPRDRVILTSFVLVVLSGGSIVFVCNEALRIRSKRREVRKDGWEVIPCKRRDHPKAIGRVAGGADRRPPKEVDTTEKEDKRVATPPESDEEGVIEGPAKERKGKAKKGKTTELSRGEEERLLKLLSEMKPRSEQPAGGTLRRDRQKKVGKAFMDRHRLGVEEERWLQDQQHNMHLLQVQEMERQERVEGQMKTAMKEGEGLLSRRMHQDALSKFLNALQLAKELGRLHELSMLHRRVSKTYSTMRKVDDALKHASSALLVAKAVGKHAEVLDCLLHLAAVHTQFDKSFIHMEAAVNVARAASEGTADLLFPNIHKASLAQLLETTHTFAAFIWRNFHEGRVAPREQLISVSKLIGDVLSTLATMPSGDKDAPTKTSRIVEVWTLLLEATEQWPLLADRQTSYGDSLLVQGRRWAAHVALGKTEGVAGLEAVLTSARNENTRHTDDEIRVGTLTCWGYLAEGRDDEAHAFMTKEWSHLTNNTPDVLKASPPSLRLRQFCEMFVRVLRKVGKDSDGSLIGQLEALCGRVDGALCYPHEVFPATTPFASPLPLESYQPIVCDIDKVIVPPHHSQCWGDLF